MLHRFLSSLILLAFFSIPVVQAAEAQTRTQTKVQTVVLDVPGMTCSFCPITIRKALKKVPGVITAKADFSSKTATVTFDPERTSIQALTQATANAGYRSTPRKK